MSRVTTRQSNGFRFSDAFIQRWTTILCSAIVVLPMVGIGLGFWSDHDSAPDGMSTIAVAVMCGGLVVPLLGAAVLGGEAITRGGGLIGAMLTYGLVAGSAGYALDVGWAFWTGLLAVAVAVPGFWIIGWIAKVPMYLGLPWAHGRVVRREDPSDDQDIKTDDPRVRVRPRRGGKASVDPRR